MQKDIMVSVLCTTYNHEQFVQSALEGFVRQKTEFLYEVIVHDDASTDGTAEIIREYEKKYPHIIKGIYQTENQFNKCHMFRDIMFPEAKGKYIALCEGDDYWMDECKLQKQVEFMESHKGCSLCYHNAIKYNYETGEKKLLDTFPKSGFYVQEEQIKAGLGSDFPAMASYFFPRALISDIPAFIYGQKVFDYPLRQYLAHCGDVYYFSEPMSVYRVSTPGSYMKKASKSTSFYNAYTLEMIRFFEKFNAYTEYRFNEIIENKILSDYYGYCVSISEAEGIEKAQKAGINMAVIEKIFHEIDEKSVDKEMVCFAEKQQSLFVFGTSRLANVCAQKLENAGIAYEGFVVSDNQIAPDTFKGKQVLFLSEFLTKYPEGAMFLAIQPVNANVIRKRLAELGFDRYYMPFCVKMESMLRDEDEV